LFQLDSFLYLKDVSAQSVFYSSVNPSINYTKNTKSPCVSIPQYWHIPPFRCLSQQSRSESLSALRTALQILASRLAITLPTYSLDAQPWLHQAALPRTPSKAMFAALALLTAAVGPGNRWFAGLQAQQNVLPQLFVASITMA